MAQTRKIRPAEERIAELERKIETLKGQIAKHEAKIEAIRNPKPRTGRRRSAIKAVLEKAKESGMTPEEIAKKLGIKIED